MADNIEPVGESSRIFAASPVPELNKPLPSPPQHGLRNRIGDSVLRPAAALRASHSRPSIRIQRFPSSQSVVDLRQPSQPAAVNDGATSRIDYADQGGRRRSSSEPQRPQWAAGSGGPSIELPTRKPLPNAPMPDIAEDPSKQNSEGLAPPGQRTRGSSFLGRRRARTAGSDNAAQLPSMTSREFGPDLIDMLDVVDPEVSTLTSLTNVQNSLFIPSLGKYLNRRPTYTLTRHGIEKRDKDGSQSSDEDLTDEEEEQQADQQLEAQQATRPRAERSQTLETITSRLSDTTTHYAVLPAGTTLEGWSTEDKRELNDHVRHLLHSRREKFKRSMKGFKQYVSKPLGFLVTLYATLITLFGLAWVLFLIGWVNVGGRQLYVINIIDNVLVALFAIMGDGLAPFRAVDTYHMIFIAHYHHLTWRLRREKALPNLENENDLPLRTEKDVERADGELEFSVLTPKQLERQIHHQTKFANSHTFYKPHETNTHFAFPLRLLVAVVVLLDFHSIFQIALGTCTWSISYHHRPFALTTVILCCSICCNITAGIIIMVGDRKSRKKDVVEKMMRQELTDEAIKRLEKRRRKEEERNLELTAPAVPATRRPVEDEEKDEEVQEPTAPAITVN